MLDLKTKDQTTGHENAGMKFRDMNCKTLKETLALYCIDFHSAFLLVYFYFKLSSPAYGQLTERGTPVNVGCGIA